MTIKKKAAGAAICLTVMLTALMTSSAGAGTISVSFPSYASGNYVEVYDSAASPIGGSNNSEGLDTGAIALQTSIGSFNSYCADIFDYIYEGTGYNMNESTLGTSSQYATNGSTSGSNTTYANFTKSQVNVIGALLANGDIPNNTVNSTALQIAIWEVEYGAANANGSYTLGTGSNFDITAVTTAEGYSSGQVTASQTEMTLAQQYLNDAAGYLNGSNFVSAIWGMTANEFVVYLTEAGVQSQVFLATPEPSSVALISVGLLGLWAARRRKMI
jgi:hypothetical protein